jgi:hypothetical protein
MYSMKQFGQSSAPALLALFLLAEFCANSIRPGFYFSHTYLAWYWGA